MSKKQNQTLRELDSVKYEDYLKVKAGERIYPSLRDGRCDCCGKHISELKPFGGPGDPLDGDFTESLLVKTYRPLGPYVEEAEKALREAERYYKSDGFDNEFEWMIDKYGEEKAEELYAADYYHHEVWSFWHCRDCVVLDMDEYFEKLGYVKGIPLIGEGRYEEALQVVDKALERNPDDANAWYLMGMALGRLGRYEEALQAYDKVLELNPDDEHAWGAKGIALIELGRSEEALQAYNKALELSPDISKTWYGKAFEFDKLGRYEETPTTFKKASELNMKPYSESTGSAGEN